MILRLKTMVLIWYMKTIQSEENSFQVSKHCKIEEREKNVQK